MYIKNCFVPAKLSGSIVEVTYACQNNDADGNVEFAKFAEWWGVPFHIVDGVIVVSIPYNPIVHIAPGEWLVLPVEGGPKIRSMKDADFKSTYVELEHPLRECDEELDLDSDDIEAMPEPLASLPITDVAYNDFKLIDHVEIDEMNKRLIGLIDSGKVALDKLNDEYLLTLMSELLMNPESAVLDVAVVALLLNRGNCITPGQLIEAANSEVLTEALANNPEIKE